MKKRVLSAALALCILLGLLPTAAFAQEGGGTEPAEPVETAGILIGATGSIDEENRAPKLSTDVYYAITSNGDGTYTLTFSGKGEIPDYYTEGQGTAEDGTEGKTGGRSQGSTDYDPVYPNGFVLDTEDQKHALPASSEDVYRYCTSDKAHYQLTQWNRSQYKDQISRVVFEADITYIGRYTLFSMEGVTSIEIQNPDCVVSDNAIYYNAVIAPDCTIILDSTASWKSNSVGYYDNVTEKGTVSYRYPDAEAFVEKYSELLSLENVEENKAAIEAAYAEYMAGNTVFRNAVDSAKVTVNGTKTTFGEAFDAVYEAATGTDPDTIARKGFVLESTVQYELTTDDDGTTYTLRFFDESGDGKMPDFVIDEDNKSNPERYQFAPWYDNAYRSKITHVIYDESIKRTGYLSAAHLYYCTQFDFLNPEVEIAAATIHYNAPIEAASVTLRYSGNVENAGKIIAYNNAEDQKKVSVSYLEIETFLGQHGDLFKEEQIEKEKAEALKAAFEALPTACKVQLDIDTIPGTETTYRDKLDGLLAAAGSGPVDDSETVGRGVIPSEPGEDETIHYEITTTDNETYTVRFYDTDPNGDGRMPDYDVRITSDPSTSDPDAWDAYENLPWRKGYQNSMVKYIFDDSITYVGQYVAANMNACTEYEFLYPDVDTNSNAIYYNTSTTFPDSSVTVHAYSTADINIGYGSTVTDTDKAKIAFSYYEAEQFEANEAYADLWTMSTENAETKAVLIQQACRDYNKLSDVVKAQLDTDTIPGTNTTYVDKLESLMAELNLGGNVGEDVKYTLSLNDADKYTLNLSGTGTVSVSGQAPWIAQTREITEVVLASGITSVAAGAFDDLTALRSVDVADTVTTIEDGAFPGQAFEMYGWLNHASGRYADAHEDVQLRLKDLRILVIGNSHAGDFTAFADEILADLDDSVETKVTFELLAPMGGRGLVIPQGSATDNRGSHLESADDPTDPTYKKYQAAFAKTWDVVVVQDYHESTKLNTEYGGANFADEMQKVVAWLNNAALGAKIGWFADWADKAANGADKLDKTYAQSVAAMNAVNALTENKPDFIIPASTVLQNARTSYLGTTNNAADALVNWQGIFTDFADGELDKYTILERDGTHMSLELGRQLMASAFLYSIFANYSNEIITGDPFDFFSLVSSEPVYKEKDCVWQGEFTEELWNIIAESCENAWMTPDKVTEFTGKETEDPFIKKYAAVKNILRDANNGVKEPISEESLASVFKSDAVLAQLAAIEGLNISSDDVVIAYQAPVDGTDSNPTGTDGYYNITINCHYGYSYPTEPGLYVTIHAELGEGAEEALEALKETYKKKLNSYMHNNSYSEGDNRNTVIAAKDAGIQAIKNASSESAVRAALYEAEAKIDSVHTIFEEEHTPDADCVARGQIWTGGWVYGDADSINKNSYTMDIEGNKTTYDSQFTGIWWLIRNDGNGGFVIEFYPDPAGDRAYSYETPAYNASHWLDPETHYQHSYNPLQYNQTPWFLRYRNTLTKAIVHSGVTINQHTLACYPNIAEYIIEEGANLGTNAIYFNPLQLDTVIRFKGASTVEKNAISGYRVANSYEHYIDVYGDMSQVTISSSDGMSGEPLQGNLYYAFGRYDNTVQAWVAEAQVHETIAVGLAGEGEDISTGAGFAPHYTDGVPDGTTMLRVFNNTNEHSHDEDSGNRVLLPATAGKYPCQTGLDEGYVCAVCHAVIVPQQVILGTEEHTWTAQVTKQPTDKERGEITYTCQGCGITKTETINRVLQENAVVAVNGTNYSSVQYAIDRAQLGDIVVLLKDVTENIHLDPEDDVLLDLNGHTLTGTLTAGGTVTVQDSGGNGGMTGALSENEGGEIRLLSGTYSDTNTAQYCPDGYGVIQNGDSTFTVHVHQWGNGVVTIPPTASSSGVRTYTCTVAGCGATKTETIPATGSEVDPGDDDDDNDNNNSGSSSSGSTSVRRYNIEADAGRGGDISPDGRVRVRRGENQTFRITADDGWEIADVEVDGESVGAVERYTFENVRTDHTISVTFRQIVTEPEEPQTPALPFTDVAEGAWYYDAVAYCWENGIMDGTSGTVFAPNLLLNRAMMAQVLYNLADGTASTAAGFPDVAASAWYADAVNWAAANGYVTGYDNGGYGPEDSLTREQLAVILYRYAGSPAPAGTLDGFADAASASAYAVDALRWAVGEGLLTGKDGGRLDPTGTASRAELAQILARFAQM